MWFFGIFLFNNFRSSWSVVDIFKVLSLVCLWIVIIIFCYLFILMLLVVVCFFYFVFVIKFWLVLYLFIFVLFCLVLIFISNYFLVLVWGNWIIMNIWLFFEIISFLLVFLIIFNDDCSCFVVGLNIGFWSKCFICVLRVVELFINCVLFNFWFFCNIRRWWYFFWIWLLDLVILCNSVNNDKFLVWKYVCRL